MTDIKQLLSLYRAYKAESELSSKSKLRDDMINYLSILLINNSFNKNDPIVTFKEIRKTIEDEKIKELSELQRAFDTIQKILL